MQNFKYFVLLGARLHLIILFRFEKPVPNPTWHG